MQIYTPVFKKKKKKNPWDYAKVIFAGEKRFQFGRIKRAGTISH